METRHSEIVCENEVHLWWHTETMSKNTNEILTRDFGADEPYTPEPVSPKIFWMEKGLRRGWL